MYPPRWYGTLRGRSLLPASAGAEGPATSASLQTTGEPSTFVGFVFRDADGNLATKVRAIGADGTVCGTASVTTTQAASRTGFYRMEVVGHDTREGCPRPGQGFAFRLLYGNVDDGSFAVTSQLASFQPGTTQVVSLTPNPSHGADGWLGELPSGRGAEAVLVWVGADGTPIEDALALLDVDVYRASHHDAASDHWLSYTAGGASFLQTYTAVRYGDVVRVRAR